MKNEKEEIKELKHTHTLIIEGKEFEWANQFIIGAEVKKIGRLPKESKLYLVVADPWDDELIDDETQVNLARPEIEQFLIKKKLSLTINKKRYDWDKQFITAKELRQLGGVNLDEDLFLEGDAPGENELIEDDAKIDLARPGIEHFISKETIVEVTIIVNGTPKKWKKKRITFVEVIIEAFGNYIDKPTMVYTVAYEDGPKQNPEGSMVKGSSVFVKNKMIFHATATDKS
jgi:hypothetical protein